MIILNGEIRSPDRNKNLNNWPIQISIFWLAHSHFTRNTPKHIRVAFHFQLNWVSMSVHCPAMTETGLTLFQLFIIVQNDVFI